MTQAKRAEVWTKIMIWECYHQKFGSAVLDSVQLVTPQIRSCLHPEVMGNQPTEASQLVIP